VLSAGRVHARRRPVLVAEGPDREVLREPPLARGTAGRVPALLAWRDLLHVELDLRRPDRGANGLRSTRGRPQPEGRDRAPPRPAALLPLRALPAGAPAGPLAARGARLVPRHRRAEQQVLPRSSGSVMGLPAGVTEEVAARRDRFIEAGG